MRWCKWILVGGVWLYPKLGIIFRLPFCFFMLFYLCCPVTSKSPEGIFATVIETGCIDGIMGVEAFGCAADRENCLETAVKIEQDELSARFKHLVFSFVSKDSSNVRKRHS